MKQLFFAFSVVPVVAAAQSISPISTDRPTFSDGASLVPTGYIQLESGSTANRTAGSTTYTYGELITRYGLSNRVELRLTNLTWTHIPGQTDGLQDPSIGFKFWIQTGSLKRPDLSAEISSTVPIGGSQFRVSRTQPTAKLIWNQQIDSNTAITGNFIVSDLGPNGGRYTQWAESVFLSRALTPKLGLFAEVYRIDPNSYAESGGSFYDAGLTYLITNNVQVDARFGAGFDAQTNGRTFGAGISYRF